MPWKCPACQNQIRHTGDRPELQQVYRCHVCRIELVLDPLTRKLTAIALVAEVTDRRKTPREQ
jgi:transposase-like protein